MKPNQVIILSCAGLCILSAGIIAEAGPEPTKQRGIIAAVELEARDAIDRDVRAVLEPRKGANILSEPQIFSRARIVSKKSMDSLQTTFVPAGPNGVTATAAQLPFEIRRTALDPKADSAVVVRGYYHVGSKSVQLFDVAGSKYVAAAEHPLMKSVAKLSKSPS